MIVIKYNHHLQQIFVMKLDIYLLEHLIQNYNKLLY